MYHGTVGLWLASFESDVMDVPDLYATAREERVDTGISRTEVRV